MVDIPAEACLVAVCFEVECPGVPYLEGIHLVEGVLEQAYRGKV